MKDTEIEILRKVANTVRALAVDAIERAQSGHPGLPLGAADFGSYFFSRVLRHNPNNPDWLGRDRFVLSAGHGSMWLYSFLHLCGYELSLDDIKSFRQLHSKTPGHPEYSEAPGVETTTGPLGQGVACAVGMAIAQKLVAARFGEDLFDAKVWVLAGDGCMMEGVCAEASSLAGTLGLDNLVLLYDANQVCLDGPIEEVCHDDCAKRFEAYGFRVLSIDGYDYDQMEQSCRVAREEKERPVLIIVNTIIGKHAPSKQGTWKAHGGALGAEDATAVREAIGWGDKPLFYVPDEVRVYFAERMPGWESAEQDWNEKLQKMKSSSAERAALWDTFSQKLIPHDFEEALWNLNIPPNLPTRKCNEYAINKVCELLPWVISGSADLSSCDFTGLLHSDIVAKGTWDQQQVKFGVREFAMGACAYGMQLHGLVQPAVGTFLTFSDYMRNAIRLAAIMRLRLILVFSHDSVLLAEDGPTHQPVEHLMSLRLMPNFTLIRPGDENEVKAAWAAALSVEGGPVGLCFTRQDVESTVSDLTAKRARQGVAKGAYVLYGRPYEPCDVLVIATGSEIHAAAGAAKRLENQGKSVRVVSMPSWELFEQQSSEYRDQVIGGETGLRVSVEAGATLGWERYLGSDGLSIGVDTFGASAPATVLAEHFGLTAAQVARRIEERLPVQV